MLRLVLGRADLLPLARRGGVRSIGRSLRALSQRLDAMFGDGGVHVVTRALGSLLLALSFVGCVAGDGEQQPDPIEEPDAGAICGDAGVGTCSPGDPAHVMQELEGSCLRQWCIGGRLEMRAKPDGWPCVTRDDGDPNFRQGQCYPCGECR